MTTFRHLQHYVLVNGGVVLCAVASHCASQLARGLTHDSDIAGAVAGTAVLYALVFTAAAANLRGARVPSSVDELSRPQLRSHPLCGILLAAHASGLRMSAIWPLLQRPQLLPPHLPRRHRSG